MDRLASAGDPEKYRLPSAAIADDSLDFSFSGLKTAALNTINSLTQKGEKISITDMAASFTGAFTSAVCNKLSTAFERTGRKKLVIAGGVSANSHLRSAAGKLCDGAGVELYMPPISLCGDNGAMIAAQAYHEYMAGHIADISQNAFAYDSF